MPIRLAAVLNEAGIPAHTVSATGYFSAVEVQTVLAMLRILDNPRQDIPLAAVLKSPIAGLTDEELGRLRAHDRSVPFCECVLARCRELAQSEEPLAEGYEKKLWEFWKLYERLRALVPDTPIHELIEIVLKESGYGNYAAAMPAGARRRANLRMLVEKAIAYENTSYKGLFHFVRYIDELQKYDVDFGEADMVGENEDVVRIMSIHKSKGLEFPVVFVCGLGRNFNKQDTRSRMVLHPELGIGIDWIDGERRIKTPTILKRAIAKQIELENLGEELRVLYVALTRAKEKLILTGCRKEAENDLAALREAAPGGTFPGNGACSSAVSAPGERGRLFRLAASRRCFPITDAIRCALCRRRNCSTQRAVTWRRRRRIWNSVCHALQRRMRQTWRNLTGSFHSPIRTNAIWSAKTNIPCRN